MMVEANPWSDAQLVAMRACCGGVDVLSMELAKEIRQMCRQGLAVDLRAKAPAGSEEDAVILVTNLGRKYDSISRMPYFGALTTMKGVRELKKHGKHLKVGGRG